MLKRRIIRQFIQINELPLSHQNYYLTNLFLELCGYSEWIEKKKKNEQPTGIPPTPQLEGDEEEAKQEEA